MSFLRWVAATIAELKVKGFVVDESRLEADKKAREELFAEIRRIRTSDKEAYRKITDILATSYDYDPNAPMVRLMFAHLQNLVHYAIHGHTAAELIVERVGVEKPNLGLQTWKGKKVTKADVKVAKNYLKPDELSKMQRLAEGLLLDAELLCELGRGMSMQDWMDLLEGKMKLLSLPLLEGHGRVTQKAAEKRATEVYSTWKSVGALRG